MDFIKTGGTMKRVILIAVLVAFGIVSQSQENFTVIKVNGTIMLRSRGVQLQTGTVFSGNEELLFRSEDATAAVINPEKGRLILTSRNHDLGTAKPNFQPSMYSVSTRAALPKMVATPEERFSGRIVLLDKIMIRMDRSYYPMDAGNFFFLRYIYNGETINKKLSYSGDTVIIDRKALLTVDGQPIAGPDNSRMEMYYMRATEAALFGNFEMILPDTEQLTREVGVIIEQFRQKNYREKVAEINAYIGDFYGKADDSDLKAWLKAVYGLKPD
jgi:hypothetical protein